MRLGEHIPSGRNEPETAVDNTYTHMVYPVQQPSTSTR